MPIKIPATFSQKWKKNVKMSVEPKEVDNHQINSEQQDQNWRNHNPGVQIMLQSLHEFPCAVPIPIVHFLHDTYFKIGCF